MIFFPVLPSFFLYKYSLLKWIPKIRKEKNLSGIWRYKDKQQQGSNDSASHVMNIILIDLVTVMKFSEQDGGAFKKR